MNKTAYFIFILGFFLLSTVKAQEITTAQPAPLFQSDEIMHLDLQADFRKVFSVSDDSTYFPARISFTGDDGQVRTMDIRLRSRGKTRRKKEYCNFSPLRLNFPKKETVNTPFEGQNVIKLVTHCNKASHFEQNIILEYLIYKAYNVLTDSSFKVRPAIINYVYDDKKGETVQKFAFFIEREKHLAERLQGIERKPERIRPDRLDPYQTCLVDLFQYMIGNTDYSIYELHNVVIISGASNTGQMIPVPYDFDWSGLVSASYAVPNPMMNTKYVTERVYRGLRKDMDIVNRTIAIFNDKKQEIYQLFEDFEWLDSKERIKAIKYLDEFYSIINNDRMVKSEFFDQARTVE